MTKTINFINFGITKNYNSIDELKEFIKCNPVLQVNIGDNVLFGNYIIIGKNVDIHNRVKIFNNTILENNIDIHSDVIIQDFCKIGSNSIIEQNSEICRDIILGCHSVVKENTLLTTNLLLKCPHGYITTTGSLNKKDKSYGNFSVACTPLNIIKHSSYQKRLEWYQYHKCSTEQIEEYEKHFKTILNFYNYEENNINNSSIH